MVVGVVVEGADLSDASRLRLAGNRAVEGVGEVGAMVLDKAWLGLTAWV